MSVKLPIRNRYSAKDQVKSDKANKFIGAGSHASSTAAYALAWGDRANCGRYESSDRVFLSVEGLRQGRLELNQVELKKAIDAGCKIITDVSYDRNRPYNVGEREAERFLWSCDYKEFLPGEWGPL